MILLNVSYALTAAQPDRGADEAGHHLQRANLPLPPATW